MAGAVVDRDLQGIIARLDRTGHPGRSVHDSDHAGGQDRPQRGPKLSERIHDKSAP
jgi:hypothetical protein